MIEEDGDQSRVAPAKKKKKKKKKKKAALVEDEPTAEKLLDPESRAAAVGLEIDGAAASTEVQMRNKRGAWDHVSQLPSLPINLEDQESSLVISARKKAEDQVSSQISVPMKLDDSLEFAVAEILGPEDQAEAKPDLESAVQEVIGADDKAQALHNEKQTLDVGDLSDHF